MEMLLTTRYIQPGRWVQYIYLTKQAANIRLLLARNKPIIYVTGHFGNWEVVGYVLARFGFPTFSVARRMDNPYLDRFLRRIRERNGQFRLCSIQPSICEIFAITRLDEIFQICESPSEALASLA